MRQLEYIGILLWTVIRKLLGLVWIFVALPFREYGNTIVFNYVLQNKVYLKRLLERNPSISGYGWKLQDVHRVGRSGYIHYRKVSWLEYKLVYWLIWGWLDADSNEDTFDKGHNETLIRGERMRWLPEFIIKSLRRANEDTVYGNSFDLGDLRAETPHFSFWATYIWTIRNTAYNFRYMQWESDTQHFLYTIGGWEFGWKQDKEQNNLNGKPNYSLVVFSG